MNTTPRQALLLALALLAPAPAALAQPVQPPTQPTVQPPAQPMPVQPPQNAAAPQVASPAPAPAAPGAIPPDAARTQAVEQQLRALHDKLGITPAQQPQWNAFAEVRRANAARDAEAIAMHRPGAQENALQMMQDYARATRTYADNIERVLPAFEALYNVLSPQQRQAADKAFMDHRRDMMRRAGRR